MKFFIKVGPKQYLDNQREVCAKDIDYWFKKVFEKGISYDDTPNPGVDERQWIGLNCFTSGEITLNYLDGKLERPYTFEGYGGYSNWYYGAGPQNWFEFETDHSFTMGVGYDEGPVIEYGHCTKIEPPK
jgi:hypothetical protein